MAKNWALVIGINDYNPLNFRPLKYAKPDAERVKDFFEAAGFERVFFFSDNSPRQTLPNGIEIPTQATYGNLISFLQGFFGHKFLKTGDNFWFFFAGHGERYHDEDYLMPMDASAIGSEVIAGLKVNYVRERLCRCGADNVILILDACRSEGSRDGRGLGLEVQPGVITIASCQPKQKSWEVDELQQGVFTYALLEALQLPGEQSCATVERLGHYLKQRVPELCQRYGKAPAQVPRIGADPIEKQHFILIPKYARQDDLNRLKLEAYRLKDKNPALAEQICIRLNALALGRDLEVIDLLIDLRRQTRNIPQAPPNPPADVPSTRSAPAATTTVSNVVDDNYSSPQPELTHSQTTDDDLSSEKGIDYTRLRDLLKAGKWRDADRETYEVMLRAVGKKSGQWFTRDELLNFPCTDLRTIDGLWVKYSQGKFGFSVQKKIYVACGANLDGNYLGDKIWHRFCERVGWRKDDSYLDAKDIKANPAFSPDGELPFKISGLCWWLGDEYFVSEVVLEGFFSRTETCGTADAVQDNLRSEKGIDYTPLRDLLKAGKWRDADQETYEVMIRAVGKKSGDWFTTDDFLNFPCTDLHTIDRLWAKYSQGKFGFSVQKKIYVECGAKLDGNYPGNKIWNEFCSRIGWRKGNSHLSYNDLKANSFFSPIGELPSRNSLLRANPSFSLSKTSLKKYLVLGSPGGFSSLLSHRDL